MENKKAITRYTAIKIIIAGLFLAIGLKLVDIQIVHGQEFRTLSQDKSIRTIEDKAPRGKIIDRNGVELASETQSYAVFLTKPRNEQDKANLNLVIERLLNILDKNNEKIIDDFNIEIKSEKNGKYTFEFDFPNNYDDENKRREYINKAAIKWKKDNGIPEDYNPVDLARAIQISCNYYFFEVGGTRYQPHLVKEILKPDGTVIQDVKPKVMDKLDLKPSTLEAIKAGMRKVVDDGGTAAGAFADFPIKTAGKTGTAQASSGMDDYSWFSGYAPLDNPQIAVAVVIYEGGGQGGGDVARAIYSQYFGI